MVTIGILCKKAHIFTNGAIQQFYFIYRILQNCGYTVELLTGDDNFTKLDFVDIAVKKIALSTDFSYLDIIIFGSAAITPCPESKFNEKVLKKLQNQSVKIVKIQCGNFFVLHQEEFVFNQHKIIERDINPYIDEFWVLPMYDFAVDYMKMLTNKPVYVMPYVWTPEFAEMYCKHNNLDIRYYPEKKTLAKCSIVIMEPNMSIHKTALLPLTIANYFNTKLPNRLYKVYVTCKKNHERFNTIVNQFDMTKQNKVEIFDRIPTFNLLDAIQRHTNASQIIISHNIYNRLNFLHLEMMYFGYPIIHNCYDFRENGLYYDEHKGMQAFTKINHVLQNFHKIHDQYVKNCNKIIDRYDYNNEINIFKYKEAVERIIKPEIKRNIIPKQNIVMEIEEIELENIVVIPTQGLANRLRMIYSANLLAKQLECNFYVIWNKEPCCNIEWNDLFQNKLNTITKSELNNHCQPIFMEAKQHTMTYINQIIKMNKFKTIVLQGGHEFKTNKTSIQEFLENKKLFYRTLIPNMGLIKQIDAMKENLEDVIGIHYRETIDNYDKADNLNFHINSPLDKFIEKMKEYPEEQKFYLATNKKEIKEKLKELFLNRILTLDENEYERNNKEGLCQSVLDFFNLSNCKKIIGSHMSSFSDEAVWKKNIEKEIIYKEFPITNNSYHCFGFCIANGIGYINKNL